MNHPFQPTDEAWQAALEQVDIDAYGRSRNHLTGAVTKLSPWITHGFVTLPQLAKALAQRAPFGPQHKLYAEFAWREFYQHVWHHLGDRILQDIRPPLPGIQYSTELPQDIRQGATGLSAVDLAVRELYATGYLHNHARMWLASYIIHFRKIHWRAGADWMFGHLLDGDLASNHLSWQWVAGTFSVKPYLFNAENVAKFAPPEWHISGSALDASYEHLERIARTQTVIEPKGGDAITEPALLPAPSLTPASSTQGPARIIHPWSMARPSDNKPCIGLIHAPFHASFPWSQRRWDFVLTRMRAICSEITTTLPIDQAFEVSHHPAYADALAGYTTQATPRLLAWPEQLCNSYSQFWRRSGADTDMHRY